ncbi:MAG: sugar nucleotide-binding protein [Candidatus Sedimenticola sp. (ex Thyasira tokunagai)]
MVDTVVIGAGGVIGSALMVSLSNQGREVIGTFREEVPGPALHLDLADESHNWQLPATIEHAVICAGITDVMRCQHEPRGTWDINVESTCRLIELLHKRGAQLLYLSSNQVFSGERQNVGVNHPTDPSCEYGRQKVAVERFLARSGQNHQILRLGKVVDGPMKIIGDWSRMGEEGCVITPFQDFNLSPIPLNLVISVISDLLACREFGIFHLTAKDEISYLHLARYWARQHPSVKVKGVIAADSPELRFFSRRYASLDCGRLVDVLGMEIPVSQTLLSEMSGSTDNL